MHSRTVFPQFVLVFAMSALVLLTFCTPKSTRSTQSTPEGEPFVIDEASAGSALVTPEEGGVVRTATGDTLVIPPAAITEAVDVTMAPIVLPTEGRVDVFAAVKLRPDGLKLLAPATLTVALSKSLAPGLELDLAESHEPGAPTEFGPGDALFVVDDGGTTATGQIYGFSSKAFTKNCHSGTRDNVLARWAGRPGRDAASIKKATGVMDEDMYGCQLDEDPLQRMFAPYFTACAEFPPGSSVDASARAMVARTLAEGRQVVFLFGGDIGTDVITGYRRPVDHTGVGIRTADGSIVIRNQLNITNLATLHKLEMKQTAIDLSFSDIDNPVTGMRWMRRGEGLAMVKQEPFDRTGRPLAWPHVVILCENEAPPDAGAPDAGAPDTGGPSACPPQPTATSVGFCANQGQYCSSSASCACPPNGEFCCLPGFCWARDVPGCVPETCPPNAGRDFYRACKCEPPNRPVYDPCNDRVMIQCAP